MSAVKRDVDAIWSKRGDSWYAMYYFGLGEPTVIEAKQLTMRATSDGSLSQADKLNGLEWKGAVELFASVSRKKDISAPLWSEWHDGLELSGGGKQYSVEKRNGEWKLLNTPHYEKAPDLDQFAAEKVRVGKIVDASKIPTKTLAKYSLPHGSPWDSPAELILTDVHLEVHFPKERPDLSPNPLWFGKFWKTRYFKDEGGQFSVKQHGDLSYEETNFQFTAYKFCKEFDVQLRAAVVAWRKRYPEACKYEYEE